MDKIKIATSFNIELEFETPEFHKRFFAWIIDLVILFTYLIIYSRILKEFSPQTSTGTDEDLPALYNFSALYLILFVPVLVYHLVCEITMNGQSIGKKLLGIKVISETGGRPAFYQFLLRWLVRPFDFFATLGLGALIASLTTKKNQRLGDLAAGTLVIKTRMKNSLDDTVFFELESSYQPRYKDVMRLSDRDMNVIKSILDNSKQHNNYDLAHRTSEKVRSVLNIAEYQDSIEFLETILKDYNYYASKN